MKTALSIAGLDCSGARSSGIMEMLKGLKAAIFDLDGTLLDTDSMWTEIDRRSLALHGVEMPPDYSDAVKHMEFYEGAKYTIERFSLDVDAYSLTREWVELSKLAYRHDVKLFPGALRFLQSLKASGIKLAVATSSVEDLFVPALKRLEIYGMFDAFASTSEVNAGKDKPDVYLLAAERLAVAPKDAAVFEDSHIGLETARRVGFTAVDARDIYKENY